MAHFAKIRNAVVEQVQCVSDDDELNEDSYAHDDVIYRRTSYNTRGGVHYTNGQPSADQNKSFRKNYAGIGDAYDSARDAFIPPQPYPSWTLNESTCLWESPVPHPNDDGVYAWDENNQQWTHSTP